MGLVELGGWIGGVGGSSGTGGGGFIKEDFKKICTNVNSCHPTKYIMSSSGRYLRFSGRHSRKRKFVPENKIHHIMQRQKFAI